MKRYVHTHIREKNMVSQTSSLKSVFKPLIASSLVLALGINVSHSASPQISYGQKGSLTPIDTSLVNWNGGNNPNIIQPQSGDFSILVDNEGFDTIITPNEIVFKGGKSDLELIFDTNKHGMILSSNGNLGNLSLDLGYGGNGYSRTVKMIFDGSMSKDEIQKNGITNLHFSNYSLVGNLSLLPSNTNDPGNIDISFANSMKGSIFIKRSKRNQTINIIFGNNANLDGNLITTIPQESTNKTLSGRETSIPNDMVSGKEDGKILGNWNITFGSSTNSTNILAGYIRNIQGAASIVFNGKGEISNGVKADGSAYSIGDTQIRGINLITFKADGKIGNLPFQNEEKYSIYTGDQKSENTISF